MSGIGRRRVLQGLGAGLTLAGLGLAGAGRAAEARVVIAGGGFGGATCARYLKQLAPSLHVTLVDRREPFVTGPFCNTVLAGLRPLAAITHDRTGLRETGIEFVRAEIAEIDPVARRVRLADGRTLTGDRLVVAPGIDLRRGALEGYDAEAAAIAPTAWPGGPDQIRTLRRQLHAMPDGGVVAIAAPPEPYRCPPGPYERASLIAHYLAAHKPRAKLLILDAKDHFSKERLFRTAWAERHGDRIEWIGRREGGRVVGVDASARTLITADGSRHRADVINPIPPQRAGALARAADLTDGDWAPVDHRDFASHRHPGVHVLGDACDAGPMPKSAFAANAQGKACALGIAAALGGERFPGTRLINACYSLVAPDHGISVTAVYDLNGDRLAAMPGAGGLSPLAASADTRTAEADAARTWYRNIIADSFGG